MASKSLVTFSAISLAFVCAGMAKATQFSNGQFMTYDQGDWGNGGSAAAGLLLASNYASAFAAENDVLTVGVTTAANEYYIAFTGPGPIQAYEPPSGSAEPLAESLTNPLTTSSGIFGGDVVALELNIVFSNAHFLGSSNVPFGDLVLTDMSALNLSSLDGLTVNQFLTDADSCLGGGACPLTDRPELNLTPLDFTDALTQDLDASFEGGTPDTFADDHLALPTSSAAVPEPGAFGLLALGLGGLVRLRSWRVRSWRLVAMSGSAIGIRSNC